MNQITMNAEVSQFKVVFPGTLNDHDTLFGGMAMQWMDETAYIAATRYTRQKLVTVSTEKIKFLNAIKSGTIIEIIAKIIKVGKVKIDIQVEIYSEEMYSGERKKAIETMFTFAAIDKNNKPVPLQNSLSSINEN